MVPYFWATWLTALATPELTAPMRKPHSSRLIRRSAARLPVAGVVSVSMWKVSILRPSTPPLALNSAMAISMPRRSLAPEFAYCPLASEVMPILTGLSVEAA
jgi:hypothetical protein